jgi:hypothetical protein
MTREGIAAQREAAQRRIEKRWGRTMTAAFKLTPPDPFEADIHEACADALDKLLMPPAVWACYPAGHIKLHPADAARLIRAGLKRAFPDILIFCRQAFGIELKRRGGKPSKTRIVHTRRGAPRVLIGQEEMFPRLIETGAFGGIATCHSVDEMLVQLATWRIPLRAIIPTPTVRLPRANLSTGPP